MYYQPHIATPARRLPVRGGLHDFPGEWFVKWLFQAEYDQMVEIVHDRVDYNYNGWKGPLRCGAAIKCYPYDTAEKIINCYINLCLRDEIPEYQHIPMPGMFTGKTVLSPPNPEFQKQYDQWQKDYAIPFHAMAEKISACSGATTDLIKKHITELYWGYKDGSIPNGGLYIYPKTAKEYIVDRQLPPGVDSLQKTIDAIEQGITGSIDFLKWGIIGVLGLGILYYGSKVISTVKG